MSRYVNSETKKLKAIPVGSLRFSYWVVQDQMDNDIDIAKQFNMSYIISAM
jgi:hypothetical protein